MFRERQQAKSYAETKARVFHLLGSKCAHCGIADWRVLQIDHIAGGGTKDRTIRAHKRYSHVLESLAAGEVKHQLLCANCNWIKRYERNEGATQVEPRYG